MCICVVSLYVGLLSRLSYLGFSSSFSSHESGFFLLVFPLGLVGHLPLNTCVCVVWSPAVHVDFLFLCYVNNDSCGVHSRPYLICCHSACVA